MVTKLGRLIAFVFVASLAVGCGPSWTVVKMANPNPLLNQKPTITVAPIAFETMKIGNPGNITEADWIAKKKPDEQAKFKDELQRAKEDMTLKFAQGIRTEGKGLTVGEGGQFIVKATVIELEPGYYIGISGAPAVVKMSAVIADKDGNPLDEIVVREAASDQEYTMGHRLAECADKLGRSAGAFLSARIAGTAK